jgi:hypothetical protein
MIYVMQEKSGPQFSPQFDYGRWCYDGPVEDLESSETAQRHLQPATERTWMPGFWSCEKIPDSMYWRVPKQIFHTVPKPWKQLPDIAHRAVTERFHDLIETFDPGAHQFFPVEIIHKKSGKRYADQGQFYLWNRLPKACPQDIFDYPSLEAKGLLKITAYPTTPHKSYAIRTPSYYHLSPSHQEYVAKKSGFRNHHIVCCLPCGKNFPTEDYHFANIQPLVTEEFKSAALKLGLVCQHFYNIPTLDE